MRRSSIRRRGGRLWSSAVLALVCGACDDAPARRPALAELFVPAPGVERLSACDDGKRGGPPETNAVVDVVVHRDASVAPERIAELTAGTAAIARLVLGIELRAVSDALPLQIDPALRATPTVVREAVEAKDLKAESDEGRRVAAEVIYGPMREFVSQVAASERPSRIHLVFVPEVATRGSLARGAVGELGGLTLTPQSAKESLGEWFPVESFEPVVFVGVVPLSSRAPALRPLTIVHELGHALGLDHSDDPHDLMFSGVWTCEPHLAEADRELALASEVVSRGALR